MGTWDQDLFLRVLGSFVFLKAAWTTLWVATVAQAIGTAIGLVVGPMLMASALVIRAAAVFYLWIFRGTPLLAQILFFYAVLPQLGLTLSVIATGLLALGINEGARMAEIVRSGLLSVPAEQREAAVSLGLKWYQVFFLVVLPQAMRTIVPPLGNNYSYMIKATSLLSVISFSELLRTSQQLAQSTARPLEIYAVAAIYYLAIVTGVTIVQRAFERRLSRNIETRPVRPPDDAKGQLPLAASVAERAPPISRVASDKPVVLEARGISKRLGATLAVDRVDLEVRRGEVVMIVGPSGSGKSTLLRCLNHLEPPDEGTVVLEGEPLGVSIDSSGRRRPLPERAVDRQRRRIGMVFQRFNLFPHLTAADNVALGLRRVEGRPWPQARNSAQALLGRFGLADKARQFPAELSGGQRQRVAIARAMALDPLLLLFDEPTSALDPETVHEVLAAIRDLAAEGKTMVVVTHEIGFARAIADRVIVMERGRVIAVGPPADVLGRPPDPLSGGAGAPRVH